MIMAYIASFFPSNTKEGHLREDGSNFASLIWMKQQHDPVLSIFSWVIENIFGALSEIGTKGTLKEFHATTTQIRYNLHLKYTKSSQTSFCRNLRYFLLLADSFRTIGTLLYYFKIP